MITKNRGRIRCFLILNLLTRGLLVNAAFTASGNFNMEYSKCFQDDFRSISRDRMRRLFVASETGDDEVIISESNESQTISVNDGPSTGLGGSGTSRPKKKDNLLEGRWEYMHGNYVLRPSKKAPKPEAPKALVHFLGGAFVGASPHNAYRYILEKLSEKGYIIVATPYQLTFDHLETCDEVISKFEECAPSLARQYGAIPVVGMGHSCGALLQVLITSLFPDTPRAANVLISYNNKPIKDAVPVFDEVVSPLSVALASSPQNVTLFGGSDDDTWSPPSLLDALSVGLRFAKSTTDGDILPSDEMIDEFAATFFPPDTPLSDTTLPKNARDILKPITSSTSETFDEIGVLPVLNQVIQVAEQIPSLLQEVADGVNDFIPPPESVAAVAKKAYRARATLLMMFENDSIDETDELETVLCEAERIMRMKRPMVSMGIDKKKLSGNHATPILAPPLVVASRAEEILGNDAREKLLYNQADNVAKEMATWLEQLGV